MPTRSPNRFETLHHTVYGGEEKEVPLYVDSREGLTEESRTLLHAVNIIGGNLDLFENGIKGLSERIDRIASGEYYPDPDKGIIISDKHSASSLSIDGLNTRVSVSNVGAWDIDTALIADMVREWSCINES